MAFRSMFRVFYLGFASFRDDRPRICKLQCIGLCDVG